MKPHDHDLCDRNWKIYEREKSAFCFLIPVCFFNVDLPRLYHYFVSMP